MRQDREARQVVTSYGAGVNSTAMILFIMEGGDIEDLSGADILFADTGGEWPETYEYLERFKCYLGRQWGLEIVTVRAAKTLEQHFLDDKMCPIRINRSCSDKFKHVPLDKWARKEYPDGEILKLIGIDAGEEHRASIFKKGRLRFRYPLVEMDIDRTDCERIITRHGLPLPRKSGCFYCPFQRVGPFVELAREHPDLFERACKLEENGERFPETVLMKGYPPLREWVPPRAAQPHFNFTDDERAGPDSGAPCGCFL